MPARTYMVIDERHDHSFRVPRPDLSVEARHAERLQRLPRGAPGAWAAAAVARWFPRAAAGSPALRRRRSQAGARRRCRRGRRRSSGWLPTRRSPRSRAPPRCALLRPQSAGAADAVRRALADAEPLVRLGALEAAARPRAEPRLAAAAPLLRDPLRAVRIEAARTLADVPAALWRPADRSALGDGARRVPRPRSS